MTCEVAVMNKLGVALAADSAVTLGDGHKTYHNADKLFQLSPVAPVGIMTYGAAEMMGVPWEMVYFFRTSARATAAAAPVATC